MADEIRAEYERLQQVAAQFSRQAVAIAQMQQRVQRCMGALRGAWQGQGSTAFFAEMENELLPAVKRLAQALSQAGRVTQQIDALLRAAEEDAGRPFRGGDAAVSAGGSGGAGSRRQRRWYRRRARGANGRRGWRFGPCLHRSVHDRRHRAAYPGGRLAGAEPR